MYLSGYKSQDLASLETYFGQDNQGYYRALSESLGRVYSPPRDVSSWVDYHLHAHVVQASVSVVGRRIAFALINLRHFCSGSTA